MKIDYFGKSDKGRIRKANEDYLTYEKIKDNEYLFVVADGMGGHRAGDVASKLGTVTFTKHYKFLRKKNNSINISMNRAVEKANAVILDKAASDPQKKGMGTTFSALIISDMKAYLAHVGDSRIYLIRDDALLRLTTDHTFVGKMVEEGRITEDEARDHPQKNILYMSLGARQSFDPEMNKSFDIREDDIFIICSDGLSNMIEDSTIKEYILSYDTRESVEQLIRLANENGGIDNITIQVIHVNKNRIPSKTEPIPVIKEEKNLFSFIKRLFKKDSTEEI
jgi:PPM family protein phosphatase